VLHRVRDSDLESGASQGASGARSEQVKWDGRHEIL